MYPGPPKYPVAGRSDKNERPGSGVPVNPTQGPARSPVARYSSEQINSTAITTTIRISISISITITIAIASAITIAIANAIAIASTITITLFVLRTPELETTATFGFSSASQEPWLGP